MVALTLEFQDKDRKERIIYLRRLLTNDDNAWRDFWGRTYEITARFTTGATDREDLASETILRILEKDYLSGYDPQFPVRNFLWTAMRWTRSNEIKKRLHNPCKEIDGRYLENHSAGEKKPEDRMMSEERAKRVLRHTYVLSHDRGQMVRERYLRGMPIRAVAEILDTSWGKIKSGTNRALITLKDMEPCEERMPR